MTFKKFLILIFVLIPLSAVQSLAAFFAIAAFFIGNNGEPQILYGIIAVAVILIANNIMYHVRYDGGGNFLLWLLDIPLALLRLPLTLLSFILSIFSLFTPLYVDPQYEKSMSYYGVKASIFMHYLMVSVDTSAHDRRVKRREERAEPSRDPGTYKLQNIWWQIKILFLTLLHSFGAVAGFLFSLEHAGSGSGGWHFWGGLIGMIVSVLAYLYFSIASGVCKGLRGVDEWYDNETVTRVSVEYSWWENDYVAKEKVVKEAGWRASLTPGMIIYMLLGWFWFIPQLITVIIAIVTPTYAPIFPCRGRDINFYALSFKDQVCFFLFGFITEF